MHRSCRLMFALVLIALPAEWCRAQLIAYEPFDGLTNGNLVGQGSGVGWGDWEVLGSTVWVQHASGTPNSVHVEDGGLSYTDPSGNALQVAGSQKARAVGDLGNARVFRPIGGTGVSSTVSDLVGGAGNSYYMSFIGKREGQTDAEANGGSDPTPENPYSRNSHLSIMSQPGILTGPFKPNENGIIGNTFVTDDVNEWAFSGVETQLGTGVTFGGGDQRFIVFKVGIGAGQNGADLVEMWVDPVLTSETEANAASLAKVMGDYGEIDTTTVAANGDFNNDQVVDAADYTVWRDNFGQPDGTLPNDGGLTGAIGAEHYDLWAANLGATATTETTVTPSNFTQAAIGLAAGNFSSSRAPGNMIFDEIRVGASWESVTPHSAPGLTAAAVAAPEPASALLVMTLGAWAAAGGAVRRR